MYQPHGEAMKDSQQQAPHAARIDAHRFSLALAE